MDFQRIGIFKYLVWIIGDGFFIYLGDVDSIDLKGK